MSQKNSGKARLLILLVAIAALSIAAVACGSDGGDGDGSSGEGVIAKIDATDRIYTDADITGVEFFKHDDDYDVEGLDGAITAIYGFYGSDPYNRQEYEARFYADHAAAMAQGEIGRAHV